MLGVVYYGNNPSTQERLRVISGQLIRMASTYKDAASACASAFGRQGNHVIVLFEKGILTEDITAITYLKKKCNNIYIVLLTEKLSDEERGKYMKCGINDTISKDASATEIGKKLRFISDREDILFDSKAPKYRILQFQIPVWKRAFDIVFSLIAIIVLSPIFLITAIAIRIESKGPILFKSKRAGTNYKIFDFLKFRSMYCDADKHLAELKKSHNQYVGDGYQDFETTKIPYDTADDSANSMMGNDGMGDNTMLGDEEVMLVGDDFVVAESDFAKQNTNKGFNIQ